jgi:hypothetical protein
MAKRMQVRIKKRPTGTSKMICATQPNWAIEMAAA